MRKIILFLLNNVVINRFLILFGQDDLIKKYINNWSKVKINKNKTLQENVGFSHSAMVDEAVKKIHSYVKETAEHYLINNGRILDIGCGVGLYLKDFETGELHGTDLSEDFLKQCKELLPRVKTYHGDYLNISFPKEHFNFVYSISVIEYIAPSKIYSFFNKIHSELTDNGILLIQYPHALKLMDKWYADLSYISYTPDKIEKLLRGKFKILRHEHSFDQRQVTGIDKKSYSLAGEKNFCNGMILIAQKIKT